MRINLTIDVKENWRGKRQRNNLPEHMQIELWKGISLSGYPPQLSCLHWWQYTHLNFNSTQAVKRSSKRFHYDIALKGKITVLVEYCKPHARSLLKLLMHSD